MIMLLQVAMVKTGFQELRSFLAMAGRSKKPADVSRRDSCRIHNTSFLSIL